MSWPRTARAQAGVISRSQLSAAGLSDDQVDGLIARGSVEPMRRGVFLVRGAPLTYDASLWAAVLSVPGVLGFSTAAHLWGVDERPQHIELIIPRALHLIRPKDVRCHRIDLPGAAVTRRHGLPVTTMSASILDHIGRLPRPRGRELADRAIQRGWLRQSDFAARVRREPGRTGNRIMRELDVMTSDGAAARSERVLHALLKRARLTGWLPNHDVWVNGDLVGVIDVAFPAARLAIEVDGFAFHTAPDRFQRDRTKQNRLLNQGWVVLRFTWGDLVDRPGYVIETIRRQLANSGGLAV